ncbi:MAG: response regulator [Deltaproteobacteria bacterium]
MEKIRPRVLVVDDDEQNLVLLSAKLEREGYDIDRARNGLQALEKTQTFKPDIILLDVMMPKMDGYEVLSRLKAGDETRYIPVVMLTGKAEIEDKVMGLEGGAEDYIKKPYSLVEIAARVKSLLRVRALQTRLRETEKMAALGEIVDGIAHEIRNPLTTIGGIARRLLEHEKDEQNRTYAVTIIKSVERLEKMLKRIDEYKWVLMTNFKKDDLNRAVEAAVSDIRAFMEGQKKDISIDVRLSEALPSVNLDCANLKRALFNILQNSVEAIDKKGAIGVTTYASEDNSVVVRITDNGCGIDEEEIRNVFNPFHTSKIEGAGLGLTISYRIIQDHRAEVDIESVKGEGTTVKIKFAAV